MATAVANPEKSVTEETNHYQVTLVIPSTGDANRLTEFTDRVGQLFAARILVIIGSSEESVITFRVDGAITIAVMLNQLLKMPEVERVDEKEMKNHHGKQKCIRVILASK